MTPEERAAVNEERPGDEHMYVYDAVVVRVVDGDTLILDVDLGMEQWPHGQRMRLAGIDTPEPRGETAEIGKAATKVVVDMIEKAGRDVRIRTLEDRKGKYGRYMAVVWLADSEVSLNRRLLDMGIAKEF